MPISLPCPYPSCRQSTDATALDVYSRSDLARERKTTILRLTCEPIGKRLSRAVTWKERKRNENTRLQWRAARRRTRRNNDFAKRAYTQNEYGRENTTASWPRFVRRKYHFDIVSIIRTGKTISISLNGRPVLPNNNERETASIRAFWKSAARSLVARPTWQGVRRLKTKTNSNTIDHPKKTIVSET